MSVSVPESILRTDAAVAVTQNKDPDELTQAEIESIPFDLLHGDTKQTGFLVRPRALIERYQKIWSYGRARHFDAYRDCPEYRDLCRQQNVSQYFCIRLTKM